MSTFEVSSPSLARAKPSYDCGPQIITTSWALPIQNHPHFWPTEITDNKCLQLYEVSRFLSNLSHNNSYLVCLSLLTQPLGVERQPLLVLNVFNFILSNSSSDLNHFMTSLCLKKKKKSFIPKGPKEVLSFTSHLYSTNNCWKLFSKTPFQSIQST